MEKGEMTPEQVAMNFQKSIAMGILQGLSVRIGNFNLYKYANDNGSKGLVELNESLTDIAIQLDGILK